MAETRTLKVKKRCCQSDPRCKRCPVVAKRLAAVGLAERVAGREFRVWAPKKAVRKARRKRRSKRA